MKKLFTAILFLAALPLAYGDELDGKWTAQKPGSFTESLSNLKKGKELLEKEKYKEALESLKVAYDEIPVIRDYTLFFMARAYNRIEKFDDSGNCVQEILKTYPDSLLRGRARALQINNIILNRETTPKDQRLFGDSDRDPVLLQKSDAVLKNLESYVADYPDDVEMTFFFARLLKKLGKIDMARKVFIRIYTGSSSYSEMAYQELQPSDITTDDMLARASNLIKAFEYKKAETVLRKTLRVVDDPLKVADPTLRDEIYKKLGLTLFRQKKYREAGEAYLKAGDLYNRARSLYRTGDLNAFNETVSKLISMEDRRAGSLLITYASKKRREGKGEEALNIYNDVRKKYPYQAEDALWGIAWTYYRSGDYKRASDLLTELNDRYPNPKYFYWKHQCSVEDSSNTTFSEDQKKVPVTKKDFYSLLAYIRNGDHLSGRPISQATWTPGPDHASRLNRHLEIESQRIPSDVRPSLDRFSILMELGMKDDAIAELIRISNRVSGPDVLVYICRTLQEVGAYKRSINLISRFSGIAGSKWGRMDINDILYPMAYWPMVSEISKRYMLDPFILLSVIRKESRFDPSARSVAGALGLMQIMPHTAYSLDRKLNLDISDNAEIYDIKINITIGAYHLNSLLKEFGSLPVALAAYNAGHAKVREWLKDGEYKAYDEFIEDIPYDETRNYVKRVLLTYATYIDLWNKQ